MLLTDIAAKARYIRLIDEREEFIKEMLDKYKIGYCINIVPGGKSFTVKETTTDLRLFYTAGWGRWKYANAFIVNTTRL